MNTPGPRSLVSGRQTRERGFTLIEVMVSALLLLIVMAGFIPVFLSGLSNATRERHRSIATNLAQERIEQIRLLDYREIGDAGALEARFAGDDGTGNDPVVRGATFHISYDPAPEEYTPTGASQPLMKVSVTVTWDEPPAPSPIVVSTMIDQMYTGPRGSWLEITPTWADPSGSPFRRVTGAVQVKYHVAQADWRMVLNDVTDPAAGVQNVYMRLEFMDDFGVKIAAGDPADDNKIDSTHVHYTLAGGAVTDVYFRWDISKIDDYYGQNAMGNGLLPDGYWETQATIYNSFDQPGNVWRLRVRVMGDLPGTPQLVATPELTADGWNKVVLNWTPGAERDRDHFVLARTGSGPSKTWNLGNLVTTFTDTGDVSTPVDPWGDDTHTNHYTYTVHAVDYSNFSGGDGSSSVEMPPPPTTTTTVVGGPTTTVAPTTTTTLGGTTTTTLADSVQLINNTNQDWTVSIRNASNAQVWSGTLTKNSIQTVTGLPPGDYSVSGSRSGHTTIPASFSMPDDAGATVLAIN